MPSRPRHIPVGYYIKSACGHYFEVTSDTRWAESAGGSGVPHRRGVCRICEAADEAASHRIIEESMRNFNDFTPMKKPPVVDGIIALSGGSNLANEYPEALE